MDHCVTSTSRSANSLVEDDTVVSLPEVHHPSYTTPLDTNLLLNRFEYLTAQQLTNLLYNPNSLSI